MVEPPDVKKIDVEDDEYNWLCQNFDLLEFIANEAKYKVEEEVINVIREWDEFWKEWKNFRWFNSYV